MGFLKKQFCSKRKLKKYVNCSSLSSMSFSTSERYEQVDNNWFCTCSVCSFIICKI